MSGLRASGEGGGDSSASAVVELLGARRAWWKGGHIRPVIGGAEGETSGAETRPGGRVHTGLVKVSAATGAAKPARAGAAAPVKRELSLPSSRHKPKGVSGWRTPSGGQQQRTRQRSNALRLLARPDPHQRSTAAKWKRKSETAGGHRPMVTSERLLARGRLRRVMHDRGSTASISHPARASVGRTCPVRSVRGGRTSKRKRHEPHGRL
jgi:hypothetical protein